MSSGWVENAPTKDKDPEINDTGTNFGVKIRNYGSTHRVHALVLGAVAHILGSWVPDWNWIVHQHRHPFTHSGLPVLAIFGVLRMLQYPSESLYVFNRVVLSGFSIGSANHLLLDIFQPGNIIGLPA